MLKCQVQPSPMAFSGEMPLIQTANTKTLKSLNSKTPTLVRPSKNLPRCLIHPKCRLGISKTSSK